LAQAILAQAASAQATSYHNSNTLRSRSIDQLLDAHMERPLSPLYMYYVVLSSLLLSSSNMYAQSMIVDISPESSHGAPRSEEEERVYAKFEVGIHQCMHAYDLKKEQPILITGVDSFYNNITEKWASRNKELGVRQYLVIALDSKVEEMAARLGFPAIAADGECVLPQTVGASLRRPPRKLPSLLSATKFLLPGMLLGSGFERVVFSEMDVFFAVNPFDATKMYDGHFLAMECPVGDRNRVNIGFMEFRAYKVDNFRSRQVARALVDFSMFMLKTKDKMEQVTVDQAIWNIFMKTQGHLFDATLLNKESPELFAINPQNHTDKTKLFHFANCNPQCKVDNLEKLYAHHSL